MRSVPILAALLCAPAIAQSSLFLAPQEAAVRLGEAVRLRAVADEAPLAWPEARTEHFFARTAWTQSNLDALPAEEGRELDATWQTDRPGVLLIGLDLRPRTETIDPRDFAEFQSRHITPDHRAAVADGEPVSVLRHESAKALVRVEHDGPEPDSIATSKTGQRVEIRPLMDPTLLTPGSDLAVKLYAKVEGGKQGLVTATNTTTGDVVRSISDDSGIANIPLGSAGRWRLEFHALAGDGEAYELHTATLTFDVREVTK